jgi:uroporphyrinogen-III decarboxylase
MAGRGRIIDGYILSSGCEVPAIAPLEKIDWFNELVDELGRYN